MMSAQVVHKLIIILWITILFMHVSMQRNTTGSLRLTNSANLRPMVQLKDDHNIITQYNIRMVNITQADLRLPVCSLMV